MIRGHLHTPVSRSTTKKLLRTLEGEWNGRGWTRKQIEERRRGAKKHSTFSIALTEFAELRFLADLAQTADDIRLAALAGSPSDQSLEIARTLGVCVGCLCEGYRHFAEAARDILAARRARARESGQEDSATAAGLVRVCQFDLEVQ